MRISRAVTAASLSTASLLERHGLHLPIEQVITEPEHVHVTVSSGETYTYHPRDSVRVTYLNAVHGSDLRDGMWILGPHRNPMQLGGLRVTGERVAFDVTGDPTGQLIGQTGTLLVTEVFEQRPAP